MSNKFIILPTDIEGDTAAVVVEVTKTFVDMLKRRAANTAAMLAANSGVTGVEWIDDCSLFDGYDHEFDQVLLVDEFVVRPNSEQAVDSAALHVRPRRAQAAATFWYTLATGGFPLQTLPFTLADLGIAEV